MKKALLLLCIPLLWGCATTRQSPQARLAELYPADRPFAESRFASFGGLRLHYRTYAPDRTPIGKIMFVHDEGASTVTFRLIAPLLASEGFAVVSVDLPGFGFSDLGLEFEQTLENRAGLLWSLADRLDTEQNVFAPADRWILAGHGTGGDVTTEMAIERPNRSAGLVLIASDVAGTHNPSAWFWFPPVRWAWGSWLRNSVYTVDGVRELLNKAYGRPATDDEVDLYAAPLMRPRASQAFVHYRETAGTVSFDLAAVPTPALVLWGEADAWTRPEYATRVAEELPNATLVTIPGAGHMLPETNVNETADAIVAFASGL